MFCLKLFSSTSASLFRQFFSFLGTLIIYMLTCSNTHSKTVCIQKVLSIKMYFHPSHAFINTQLVWVSLTISEVRIVSKLIITGIHFNIASKLTTQNTTSLILSCGLFIWIEFSGISFSVLWKWELRDSFSVLKELNSIHVHIKQIMRILLLWKWTDLTSLRSEHGFFNSWDRNFRGQKMKGMKSQVAWIEH